MTSDFTLHRHLTEAKERLKDVRADLQKAYTILHDANCEMTNLEILKMAASERYWTATKTVRETQDRVCALEREVSRIEASIHLHLIQRAPVESPNST